VPAKDGHHVVRDRPIRLANLRAVLGQQMPDQGPQIVGTFAQWRHPIAEGSFREDLLAALVCVWMSH
jgi:hypothetical protein